MQATTRSAKQLIPLLGISIILLFTLKMLQIVWPYTSWALDVDFLVTKQRVVHLLYYRLSFYAHIFSSLFVLVGGAVLFSKYILQRWPMLHRWTGRLYVGLVLLVSAPSGMVMAFHANAGPAAQASFLLLAPLWWWFTWKGFDTARKKQFGAHKNWMLRSYALTLSALSLRVYQFLISQFFVMDPIAQYVLVSWAGWILNWAVVELWIWRKELHEGLGRHDQRLALLHRAWRRFGPRVGQL